MLQKRAFITFALLYVSIAKYYNAEWFDEEIKEIGRDFIPKGEDYTKKMAIVIAKLQTNISFQQENSSLSIQKFGGDVCHMKPSDRIPTSVHKLRPADIQVVGAMGDSLTAGNGILANTIIEVLFQYRGYSFSIGGSESHLSHLTLPNILKKSNNKLHGYSTGGGWFNKAQSYFNVAQPGNKAEDMPGQAEKLVKKIQESTKIDYKNDWKMINLFVGGNDICDYCKDKERFSAKNYEINIIRALDILHKNLPRTFVNLIELLDISLVKELKNKNFACDKLLSWFLCRCVAGNASDLTEVKKYIRDYQKAVRNIASSGRYDKSDDFTVVVQPFFRNSKPKRMSNGKYDMTLFSPDCFHFGRKGHDLAGKSFWNNLLQPVGKKDTEWTPNAKVMCPTEERPYLATQKN